MNLHPHSLSPRPRYFFAPLISVTPCFLLSGFSFKYIKIRFIFLCWLSFNSKLVVTSWVSRLLFPFLWAIIRSSVFASYFLRLKGSGSTCREFLDELRSSHFYLLRYFCFCPLLHRVLASCMHLPSASQARPTWKSYLGTRPWLVQGSMEGVRVSPLQSPKYTWIPALYILALGKIYLLLYNRLVSLLVKTESNRPY